MNFSKIFIIMVIAMIVIAASDLSEAKKRKRRKHRKHKHGHKHNANHGTNGREHLTQANHLHHQHHRKPIIRIPYYVQPFAVPMGGYGTGHAGHNNFFSKPNSVAKPTAVKENTDLAPSQDRLNNADGILPVEPNNNATAEQSIGNGIRIPIYYYFVNEANNASGLPVNPQVIASDEFDSSALDDRQNGQITDTRRVNTMPMIVLDKNAGTNIYNLNSDRYMINNAIQLPMSVREIATAKPVSELISTYVDRKIKYANRDDEEEMSVKESDTNDSRFDFDNSAKTELSSLGIATIKPEFEQKSNVTNGQLNDPNEGDEIVIPAINLADDTSGSNRVDSISEPEVSSHGSATTELESEQKSIVTDGQLTDSNQGDEILISALNPADDINGSNRVDSISESEVSSHGSSTAEPETEQNSSATDEEVTETNQRDEIITPASHLDDNETGLSSDSNQADEAAEYLVNSQENTTLEPTIEPKYSVTDEQVTDSNQNDIIPILKTETHSNGLYFFNPADSQFDNNNKPSMSDQENVSSKYDTDLRFNSIENKNDSDHGELSIYDKKMAISEPELDSTAAVANELQHPTAI